jgi:hypothetical protein
MMTVPTMLLQKPWYIFFVAFMYGTMLVFTLTVSQGTICDELESENGKLRSELQSIESELRATRQALRIAERSAALIPQVHGC